MTTQHKQRAKEVLDTPCDFQFFCYNLLFSMLFLSFPYKHCTLPQITWFPYSGQVFFYYRHIHFDLFEYLGWWLHSLGPPQMADFYVFFIYTD